MCDQDNVGFVIVRSLFQCTMFTQTMFKELMTNMYEPNLLHFLYKSLLGDY